MAEERKKAGERKEEGTQRRNRHGRAVEAEPPVRERAVAPVPPEAVVSSRGRLDGPLRPQHLYNAVALAFVLALTFKFFDTLARVFLLVYASAILAILFGALRTVIPLQRRWLAGIVGVSGIGGLVLLLWLGVPAVAGQVRGLLEMAPAVGEMVDEGIAWVEERTGVNVPRPAGLQDVPAQEMTGGVGSLFGRAFTALEVLLVPVILFFGGLFAMARPNERLLNPLFRVFPSTLRTAWYRIFQLLSERLMGWLKGTGIAMLGVGLLSTAAFSIIGIPNPVALGVINGIFEFIPIFGPWIGGIAAILVALVDDPVKALWTTLAVLAIQQIESYVITPWAMSANAELHPFITLFALVVFGGLFGFLGILLALPLALLVWTVVQVLWVERAIDTDGDEIAPLVEE